MFLLFGLLSTVTTGFESPKTFIIPLLVALDAVPVALMEKDLSTS